MGVLRNAMLHQCANILFGNCTLLIKFQYRYTTNKYTKELILQYKEIIEYFRGIMLQISALLKSILMFSINGKTRSSFME